MQVLSASATAGLTLKARAETTEFAAGAGKLKTAVATVGGTSATSYPDATVGYAFEIECGAFDDLSVLDYEAGTLSVSDGAPVFTGSGKDFSGSDLPSDMTKIYAIRVSAPADNDSNGQVTFSGEIPELGASQFVSLRPGDEVLMKFKSGITAVGSSSEIGMTSIGDKVTIEVIAS